MVNQHGRQDILNLFRFVDWMMRLPDELEQEWVAQVEQLEAERHMQYISSVERFAMQKGHEEGRDEGLREGRREEAIHLLLRVLTHRFGEVPEPVQTQLHSLTLAQTEALVDLVLTSQSLPELIAHLPAGGEMAPSA